MNTAPAMNRRAAIAKLALLMGGAVVGAESFLRGSPIAGKQTAPGFAARELALLDEIGETIIPTTDTPGAKAVGIGAFMAMMVNDCYDDEHHAIFKTGLARIEEVARAGSGKSFGENSPAERTALLDQLDAEERAERAARRGKAPAHYFRMMKQLTLLGYFTSEIGCTQALRYVEVPGSFRGNEPYKRGDRTWFVAPSISL